MKIFSFLSHAFFFHIIHLSLFSGDILVTEGEEIIPILCDVTRFNPKDNFIPESGVIEVPELDLVVAFKNHEEESSLYLFDFSESQYFYTIYIVGKVRDVGYLKGQLIIDIAGPRHNERFHYGIIRHAEHLSDEQERIINQLQNMVIHKIEAGRDPCVLLNFREYQRIKSLPRFARRVLLKVIQKDWVLERTLSCKF